MTRFYKSSRMDRRILNQAPVPPRKKQVKLVRIQIVRLWHIRNSNSLIYLWRNKWNQIIRTRGYQYQYAESPPPKPRTTIKDLGKPPGEMPRPITNLVQKIMEEINNMTSVRVKRALRIETDAQPIPGFQQA